MRNLISLGTVMIFVANSSIDLVSNWNVVLYSNTDLHTTVHLFVVDGFD